MARSDDNRMTRVDLTFALDPSSRLCLKNLMQEFINKNEHHAIA